MAYVRIPRPMQVTLAPRPGMGGLPQPIGAADAGSAGSAGTTGQTTTVTSIAGTAVGGKIAQPVFWVIAYGSITVGFVVGVLLYTVVEPSEFEAAAGFDALAAFYIVAQGLERLFEPAANFVRGSIPDGGAQPAPGAAAPESLTRPQAVARLESALATAATTADAGAAERAVEDAARAKATIDQIRANAALSMWGIQSGLAMVLAGGLGLFLLRGVGAGGVPVPLDIFVTGIAIGGGSKALHDLIKSVQVSKESKQDPPEAGGAV